MERDSFVISCLASEPGSVYTPIQVQKLLFLVDRNVSCEVGGPFFDFQPYLYGPFDKTVYIVLDSLIDEGLVEKVNDRNWKSYKLSRKGQVTGSEIFSSLPPAVQDYIQKVSKAVRSLSFRRLVSAIYESYPEMKRNSIFIE